MNTMRTTKLIAIATLALFALGATGCASSKKQKMEDKKGKMKKKKKKEEKPVEREVVFGNGRFNPNKLTVPKNSKITFKNVTPSPIAVKIGALDVDHKLEQGESWSHTFKTTGEFLIENRLADNPQKMTLKVK